MLGVLVAPALNARRAGALQAASNKVYLTDWAYREMKWRVY